MKKDKTILMVVDFSNKKLLLKEEVNNNSTAKKEKEKIEKFLSAVDLLTVDFSKKQNSEVKTSKVS